jgi:DNA-binding PadR family transcriptional regulator
MVANTFLKKYETVHGIDFDLGRKIFRSLRKKGYYDTKGKAEGKTRTTFQLTPLGIQYLTDNNLFTAPATETPAADAPTEDVFDAKIWLDDLIADYGEVTSEMLDELVATELLTRSQAEEIYALSNQAA